VKLSDGLGGMSPQARKLASYVLENPNDVGVSTVREIADAAQVTPNTVVRLAQAVGYEGYDDFRAPFRAAIRQGAAEFPDRARWLQGVAQSGDWGALYADMVGSALRNIEETFAGIDADLLRRAAERIWTSRRVYTLGVGVNNANARNFTYLASTGMVDFHAIPRPGSTATDDLAWADARDVVIAITCKPYRTEVVEAVNAARAQGVCVVGISDSPASPIIVDADYGFVIASETPQFFPSSVATVALLETLLSFIIASASPDIIDRVETFHKRRHDLGLYNLEG